MSWIDHPTAPLTVPHRPVSSLPVSMRDDAARLAQERQSSPAAKIDVAVSPRQRIDQELHKLGVEFAAEAKRLGIPTTRFWAASGPPWKRRPEVRGWVLREPVRSVGRIDRGLSVTEEGGLMSEENERKPEVIRRLLIRFLSEHQ